MAESHVKQEPDSRGASPAPGFADDDIYEDAGDLEFNSDPKFQRMYLARVPNYLWEAWSSLDDEAEIQIGTIRQSTEADGRAKLEMLLRSDLGAFQMVPKEYEMEIREEKVQSTFIFTEQDLPGFKSKSNIAFDPATANLPARLTRPQMEKSAIKQPWDKNKRFQPYFRRAIPKKTTLVGKVAHEINCIAVLNAETDRILMERTMEAMKPKKGTTFIQGNATNLERGFVQPGTVQSQKAFGGFIKNTGTAKSGKASQDTKTARMPQNELLDLIFVCFREYTFWSMKSLRARLRQPEAYLRETLEKIADMPRSGRFAMHWTLKPEFKQSSYGSADDAAPMAAGGGEGVDDSDLGDLEGEDDDDDDNVKMEDVMPS